MDGHADDEPPVVRTTYVSSAAIVDREARALQRALRSMPGYWRPFVVRRSLSVLAVLGIAASLGFTTPLSQRVVLTVAALAFLVMVALTALDIVLPRRRELDELRRRVEAGCPPGTEVEAAYSRSSVVLRMPWSEHVTPTDSVVRAEHSGGVLLLFLGRGSWPTVVPDELVGEDALVVLRTALGRRLVER